MKGRKIRRAFSKIGRKVRSINAAKIGRKIGKAGRIAGRIAPFLAAVPAIGPALSAGVGAASGAAEGIGERLQQGGVKRAARSLADAYVAAKGRR